MNRDQLDFNLFAFEDDRRTSSNKLTNAALSKAAAYGDALRVLPFFEPQKALDYYGKFLRELLDGGLNNAGGLWLSPYQHTIKFGSAELSAIFSPRTNHRRRPLQGRR